MTLLAASEGVVGQTKLDDSGISAGFFDSSEDKDISFSTFHLPPLAVLFENAKANPSILKLAKAQEIAQAEVTKQKKHIFSYVNGHASYSYGKTDVWGNGSGTFSPMVYQFQGSTQNYWNVGVNLNVPLEDILDLTHSVKRKRLLVESARLDKDIAYDQLKLQITTIYIRVTNNLNALKTAGISSAIYQGSNELNQLEFHDGNMEIESYAYNGQRSITSVSSYQTLLTQITTDIITLEILSHTPILTNTTTEVTLDNGYEKSAKEIAKENKAIEKQIKKTAEEEQALLDKMEKEAANQKGKDKQKDNNSKKSSK